ncbi:hypothetical protein J40TS1_00990 [Paenibacillus montaniterrae]|uniref:Nuclease n=1 Tax=Paenibacillus montaniterrae TaxID=429341 RepID=A0A919YJG9_9BACL|nr:lamin tail domain-containing protein [Paenibacillus montaniterrae]GIP14457.1 hypothetical protein J40TS1_00990 [Paenibacillus montaniterrae]
MKNLISVACLFAFLLLAACSSLSTATSNVIKENTWYPIGKVISNDSFEIVVGDHIEQVTFLSLDVVDINHEVLGDRVHEFLTSQLTASEEVSLSFDQEVRNESGQLQAIVQLKDGTKLNEVLLEAGYAKVLIVEPNIKMENIYKKHEQLAKSSKTGIWYDEHETSNEDVALKETTYKGIRLSVVKEDQKAIISNYTSQDLDLSDWKLVSVTGNQIYIFEDLILEPGETAIIYSKNIDHTSEKNALYWGNDFIWSLSEKESAELYNTNNELIAEWTE